MISRSGGVVIAALGGNEIFSGINTYTGNTTIKGGLTLGDGVSVGQVGPGPTGALQFEEPLPAGPATYVTIANAIGGAVNVDQFGVGVVALTGNNTYSGATDVSGGQVDGNFTAATLRRGNGTATGTLGSGAGQVSVFGQLIFNEGGPVTVLNTIVDLGPGDVGSLLQTGPGTVTLDGGNTQGSAPDLLIGVTLTSIDVLNVKGTASLGGTVTFAYAPGTYNQPSYDFTFLKSAGLGGIEFLASAASKSEPLPATPRVRHFDRATGFGAAASSRQTSDVTGAVEVSAPVSAGVVLITLAAGVLISSVNAARLRELDALSSAFAVL